MSVGTFDFSREKFEEVVIKTEPDDRAYPLLARSRSDSDGYLDLYIQLKWQGWKLAIEGS